MALPTPPGKRIGRPALIGVDRIVDVAGEIGLADLSMSEVARRLGVKTASLYGHVGGIDDLRERVVVRLFESFELPDAGHLDLRGIAFEVGRSLRRLLRQHPGLADAVLRSTPEPVFRQYLETVQLYVDRGVDPAVGALIGEDVAGFVFSYDRVDLSASIETHHSDALRWPERPDGTTVDPDDVFEWTLAAHLDGVIGAIERDDLPWNRPP
ncbi:MAG: TetR/AcrR family transcriptional regulator [Actinomycetota bacterium]